LLAQALPSAPTPAIITPRLGEPLLIPSRDRRVSREGRWRPMYLVDLDHAREATRGCGR